MIPYIELQRVSIGPFSFAVTSLLVAAALITGHLLLIRQARLNGFDPQLAAGFSASMIVGGVILGHLVKYLYRAGFWEQVRRHPWEVFNLFSGQASFGGLAGGLLAGYLYLRLRRLDGTRILRLYDCLAQVFPYAWIIGRMQCVVSHDHPGIRTTSWLGVRYPDAVRYDLGVLEVLYLFVILALFHLLQRRTHAPGFYLATFLMAYGLFRLALDQLHVDVVRYLTLSVDQWASVLFLCGAAALAMATLRASPTGPTHPH